MTVCKDNRVLYNDQPASVVRVQGEVAYILLDTQRPSSVPKPVPVSFLTLISKT